MIISKQNHIFILKIYFPTNDEASICYFLDMCVLIIKSAFSLLHHFDSILGTKAVMGRGDNDIGINFALFSNNL